MKLETKETILSSKELLKDDYWIYFLIKDDEIVYVGQTIRGMHRIKVHQFEGKKDFDSFSYLVCDKNELDYWESRYILKYDPKYNSQITYSSLDDEIGTKYFSKTKIKDALNTTKHVINRILKENSIDFKEIRGKRFYDVDQINICFEGMVEDLKFIYKRYRLPSRSKSYEKWEDELQHQAAYIRGESHE